MTNPIRIVFNEDRWQVKYLFPGVKLVPRAGGPGFSLKLPVGWHAEGRPGEIIVYSGQRPTLDEPISIELD